VSNTKNETLRYYEEEINFLVESGREFARLHPGRAEYLALLDPRYRDPHVERLIESFAFLSGRIRRRLDDEFPELTHALMQLVWPHYMQPIPSMAILQFRPEGLQETLQIETGFLVDSEPASNGVPCRFQTCFDVEIYPFQLEKASFITDEAGRPVYRLHFVPSEGADLSGIELTRLRLYLGGETAAASGLYHILRREVEAMTLRFSRENFRNLPSSALRAAGFLPKESVLPFPEISFPGYRLLSEYFCFPEKFHFIDIMGVGALDIDPIRGAFDLDIRLKNRPPEYLHPGPDSFALYATPIINIFPREGEPITVDHLKTRYRVLGDYTHPEAFEVTSVDDVQGLHRSSGKRSQRNAFLSFEFGGNTGEDIYYHVSHAINDAGNWETYLSLISQEKYALPETETLSLSLTCTNGRFCEELKPGNIRRAVDGEVEGVRIGSITVPTPPIYPAIGEGAEWRFISHMALNFLSVAEAGTLRAVLELYNLGNNPGNARRIDGIQEVGTRSIEALVDGSPIRGTEIMISIDETKFDNPGDLLIFSEVLNEFLALHAALNSFVRLKVRSSGSGEVYSCPMAHGRKPPV